MLSAADLPELDDPGAVETLGADLVTGTTQLTTTAESVQGAWTPLATAYDAPEGPTVWTAMDPQVRIATELGTQAGTAAGALSTYAAALREFATRKAELESRIAESHRLWNVANATPATLPPAQLALAGDVGTGINPEYQLAEARATSFEAQVLDEMATFVAELTEAQRTCANAIGAIHGAPQWVAAGKADVGYEYVWGTDADGVIDAVRTGANGWSTPTGWHTSSGFFGNILPGAWNDIKGAGADLWALSGLGSDQGATDAARSGLKQLGADLWHFQPLGFLPQDERNLQANERLGGIWDSMVTGVKNDPGTAVGTVLTGLIGGAGVKAGRVALAAPKSALAAAVRNIELPVIRLEMREITVPALAPAPAVALAGGTVRDAGQRSVRVPAAVRDGSVTVGQVQNHVMAMTGRGTYRGAPPPTIHIYSDDIERPDVVVSQGGNIAVTTLDPDTGHLAEARGHLEADYGNSNRSADEQAAQDYVRGLGVEGDHAGHHSAHRFFHDGGLAHLFPQNGNFNLSAWRKMENEWADWIAHGMHVDYKIDFDPPGAARPDKVVVNYEVKDPSTGETVFRHSGKKFSNTSGEEFDRIKWLDMRAYINAPR